ncbi:Superfamily I DNA and RNA helicases and helicase subunits-like protein [Nitrosococcus oceani ATCC 19707]|uniref:Superfamily I DNA and RNA helicases and helicase subunits-like protein n=2 Tax=Nitrosococcus oceani TaxID=1229 RepID=Q3JCL4_NITOC|nr:AAA domain-containing protein [Nitrosococcus oceani]ABA57432.1 Superfamily I DNA and RNA helicases and helicase subunits-like protein [Nitrosococcus oceani ATCC 19707]EDZ66691.1 hypothetical protein NOC27_18 [Nitrosococcus oceani AFC27]KFI20124.1 ATPase AAA [Nitrosococcus oceani C-27]GEM21445.1 ATPase AAA [Nitrosococcus oceani]
MNTSHLLVNDQPVGHPANQKVVRLIHYLTRLASLRSKLIRDLTEYEKILWISDVPHEHGCFTRAWGQEEEKELDEWLAVQNRREPELPIIPEQCKEWVNQATLREKDRLPELLPEIIRQSQDPDGRKELDRPATISMTERLEEHPGVQQAWNRYLENKWLPWMEEHNIWEQIHKVYSALFAIHQAQLRLGEEYELVLGLGLLTWQTPTGQHVRRHLVVANALLEFEARLGKFTVRPYTESVELRPELDMLDIEERPAHAEETAKSSLSGAEDDPWAKERIDSVLQALVHSINSQGTYDDSLEMKNIRASARPVVEYAPALILRKRSTKGLSEILGRIKKQIESDENVPSEFADLAEISARDERELDNDGLEGLRATFNGEVYFPKPSNDEQRRIIDKLRSANGVLVQGPPGTGKSHTIANLICHLLATGQRTLITAKTPRALKVLEELVPGGLRPLCINLLGDGPEERRSLEASVGGILRKSEEWEEEDAERQREELETRLQELREEKAKINRRLHDIREAETHPQSVAEGTYRGTAARIAESVNKNRSTFGWFTDSVPLDKTLQISEIDLREILMALRHFTPEKREELNLAWPDSVPSSERFVQLVQNEAKASEEERRLADRADDHVADLLANHSSATIENIRDALARFRDTRRKLIMASHSWMKEALRDILSGNSALWRELFRVTDHAISEVEGLVAIADNTSIEFLESIDIRVLREDARKLKEHMESGGKLGWGPLRSKRVKERLYVIKSVKVDGRSCSTIEHFSILAAVLHVYIECEKAWGFWAGQGDKSQEPYVLQLTMLKSLRGALEEALSLQGIIDKCRKAVQECPALDEPSWNDESKIERIIASCRLALARISKQLAAAELQGIETPISRIAAGGNAHPVTIHVLHAIRDRERDGFAQCMSKIQDLEKQYQYLLKRDEDLSKLRQLLPQLADCLERTCNEPYWEERVRHIGNAWHWAQARYWIGDYIRREDVPALGKRVKQIDDTINDIIAKLASLHAWSFCFSRLTESHRRHMEAWQQSMRRLGKGTGKHAPRHRREAQGHLNECREAVPAWVMPLHRVWDTVSPTPGMFDVIIVDEASQCGLEALPLLYLGKKVVIVGDDKQISPESGFVGKEAMFQLMEQFLYDFQYKDYFHHDASLFDHGKLRYGTRRITLREHFRCMPEIIRFSNDLCYSDTPLIPLRQYSSNRLPPLEHVFVTGGYCEGSKNRTINRPEANAIVTRIAELCKDSRYDHKSMGVVVLQGEAQAYLIENQLAKRLGPEEMERRRLVCGNPYSFQGDERDIMFLSLVAAANKRIGPLTKAADERRFNVAASRARDKMILFHSVTFEDLSASCLRRRLLEFFANTQPQQIAGIERDELERRAAQDNRRIVNPPAPFDSWFEVDVALELLRKEFRILPQHEVAGRRIDLVVEGGQARLAVECDGDHWHGADRYEADMQRQRQLERCGWEFFRVRESAFYANKDDALASLWRMLEEREIFPISQCVDLTPKVNMEEEGYNKSDSDASAADHASYSLNNVEKSIHPSGRRSEEITPSEIEDAILQALSKRPNQSCTLDSLTARVLKEIGVSTRGKPREKFERRTLQGVNLLKRRGRIETYKAKNQRLRLIHQEKT